MQQLLNFLQENFASIISLIGGAGLTIFAIKKTKKTSQKQKIKGNSQGYQSGRDTNINK